MTKTFKITTNRLDKRLLLAVPVNGDVKELYNDMGGACFDGFCQKAKSTVSDTQYVSFAAFGVAKARAALTAKGWQEIV